MPSAPHDTFFKSVFAQPREARGEITTLLPAEITRALKMETLTLKSGSYADRFHQQHTDLLFTARLRDSHDEAFVFLLVEHQSEPDRWMPFRLLRYMVRIWGRWLEAAPSSATELPFIFPMVVHHGERGWTAPTEMHQLFDLAKLPSAAPFTPSFSFPVDDLAKVDTVMLARRTMTMFARLALWFLRGARQDDLMLRELPHWHELFRRVAQGRDGTDRAVRALSYYATVNETEFERSKESFLALVGPALEPAMMTIAEQLQAKGRTEGKAEGEAKGKAEGEAKGLRDALSSVLQARGLAPTASEHARIQSSTDLTELHTWVTRAVTVMAVAALFIDRPNNS